VVQQHPVRLVAEDDLKRSRLTIFFRLLLALPHYIWAFFWSVLMVLVAIVNWFATLILGRSPAALHNLTAAYVRYLTHLFAYLLLTANPYPLFTGTERYPIDLEVDRPAPQRRLVTLFRLPLSIPALVLEAVFLATYVGGSYSASGSGDDAYSSGAASSSVGILWTVAFFAWFACLVLGRMPMGFRNLQAYGLRYVAQVWAYLLLLTDRYPNLDPADPPSTGPLHPVGLAVEDDLRRSRLTVFFRFLLALPHFIWLILWGVAAFLAGIVGWFAALILGRLPRALHRFLTAYLRYSTHVFSFLFLTANPFPGFTGAAGSYPVDPELPEPERQRRLVTFFRFFLAIPALAVSSSLYTLAFVAAFFGWFVSLALGRMPRSFREAQAYAIRYGAQSSAFLWLLTSRYPYSGPSLGQPEPEPEPEPELTPAEYPV
jgi:ABC-type multidrug transport system fused ATPase/permease subunit